MWALRTLALVGGFLLAGCTPVPALQGHGHVGTARHVSHVRHQKSGKAVAPKDQGHAPTDTTPSTTSPDIVPLGAPRWYDRFRKLEGSFDAGRA